MLSAAVFAFAAAVVLIITALATTDASLSIGGWAALAVALGLGAAPFALLGIALGYWAPERGALPIANLLYLGLSYVGGLWIRPADLPTGVAAVSNLLPTRAFADILTRATSGDPFPVRPWVVLGLFSAAFATLAAWGFDRDEGRHYR